MVTIYFRFFIRDSILIEELFSVTFIILLISLSNQFSTMVGSSLIFDFILINSLILLFLISSILGNEIASAASINFEVKVILNIPLSILAQTKISIAESKLLFL